MDVESKQILILPSRMFSVSVKGKTNGALKIKTDFHLNRLIKKSFKKRKKKD